MRRTSKQMPLTRDYGRQIWMNSKRRRPSRLKRYLNRRGTSMNNGSLWCLALAIGLVGASILIALTR